MIAHGFKMSGSQSRLEMRNSFCYQSDRVLAEASTGCWEAKITQLALR